MAQAKIEKQQPGPLTIEDRDIALRHILASENKLHPALFSAEAEHKVHYFGTFSFVNYISISYLVIILFCDG